MSAERVTPEQCRENAAIADDAGHRKMGAFLRDIAATIEALEREKAESVSYEMEWIDAKNRVAELERELREAKAHAKSAHGCEQDCSWERCHD